jgi:hypothetical protein
MNTRCFAAAFATVIATGPTYQAHAQTVLIQGTTSATVRDHTIDGRDVAHFALPRPIPESGPVRPASPNGDALCGAAALAWQGQPMPLGETGTLNTLAFARSANINRYGRIAFVSQVDGSARNQGIFTADAIGLAAIAIGCGDGGGSGSTDTCGDATPIGGTFSGIFPDTWATPAINDNGDVLFISDVSGGSSPRALFLYQAANQSIVKIAAVNDASPLGGTLTAVGPGSINNAGTVVFLASTDGAQPSDILMWQGSVVTKYVAVGDPAPGGGVFNFIGTESFGYLDGTMIPSGPVPAINESGQIAFRGYVSGGTVAGGELLSQNGVHEWMARAGDSAPGGGTYLDFEAPLLNNAGEIAWFSDISGGTSGAAWFAGSPDHFRRAFAFLDPIGDGIVWGMAVSRNPFRALADNGDLVNWGSLQLPDTSQFDMIVVSHADGVQDIVALQGQPTPLGGGMWGGMDGWPVMNSVNQVQLGAGTPGLAGIANAHVVLDLCSGTPAYASVPSPGSTLDFGDVAVGTTSAPLGIDIGNHGSGPAPSSDLSITAAVADDPAFVVTILNAGPFPAGSDPDGTADIEVRCAPSAAGPVAATLTVSTNDPAEPPAGFTYALTCAGIDDVVFRDGFDGS